jgi:hypothetical protein
LERLEDLYNKEETYWKRFTEKSSEEENIHSEKNILIVENLFSEIPSEVREFVEKNDTNGGGSLSESSGSVGNQNSNEEKEESESVEEISPPPPKTTTAPPFNEIPTPLHKSITSLYKTISPPLMLFKSISSSTKEESAQREENKQVFDQVGSNVIWGKGSKEVSGNKIGSSQLQVQPVPRSGPRIRQTACKRVPNYFEKFTFSYTDEVQAKSVTQAQARNPISGKTVQTRDPIRTDPGQRRDSFHGKQDPTHVDQSSPRVKVDLTRGDPRDSWICGSTQARDLTRGDPDQTRDPLFSSGYSTRAPCPDPVCGSTRPFPNWVWTRNPNLGFSSPSET